MKSRLRPEDATARGAASEADGPATLTLLSIGADLLPARAAGGRGGRRTRLVAAAVVLLAVVLVAGAYVLAGVSRSGADSDLAAAQDRQRSLQVQQRQYDELIRTTAQATALRAALASLMASDAPWSTVLADLDRVRNGVTFTAVSAGVDDPTRDAAAASTTSGTGVATPGAFAQVTITGTAPDQATVAAFVEALGTVDGFADPFLQNVAQAGPANGGSTFTVTVALTGDLRAAAAHRWATTSGGGK